MSERQHGKVKTTWRAIVEAKTDSEILNTVSETEQLSFLEKSSQESWEARAMRVLRILRDRRQQYGDANEVYAELGALWSARLGVHVSGQMVLVMMMDMKTVRSMHTPPSQDTLDDVVGYALLFADATR